jgi:hypothetical protein
LPQQQSKIQSRTWIETFVGFDIETNSYRILNVQTKRVHKTNDVYFDEHSFINMKIINQFPTPSTSNLTTNSSINNSDSIEEENTETSIAIKQAQIISDINNSVYSDSIQVDDPTSEIEQLDDSAQVDDTTSETDHEHFNDDSVDINEQSSDEIDEKIEATSDPIVSRELRNLQQWTFKEQKSAEGNLPATRSGRTRYTTQSTTSNPDNYYSEDQRTISTSFVGDYDFQSDPEYIYYTQLNLFEPTTYRQAIESSDKVEWLKEMQNEIDSMNKLKVWNYVRCPSGVKPIEGRWVFKNKLGNDNQLLRRKARFVAKEFLQIYGRDYLETHSPVAKMKSIKLLLSIVSKLDLELKQIDFDTAFLKCSSRKRYLHEAT